MAFVVELELHFYTFRWMDIHFKSSINWKQWSLPVMENGKNWFHSFNVLWLTIYGPVDIRDVRYNFSDQQQVLIFLDFNLICSNCAMKMTIFCINKWSMRRSAHCSVWSTNWSDIELNEMKHYSNIMWPDLEFTPPLICSFWLIENEAFHENKSFYPLVIRLY